MKEIIEFIENLKIERLEHTVGHIDGSTHVTIGTNYGFAKLDTEETKTSDLKYIINDLDSIDIDISEIQISFDKILKDYLHKELCKRISEVQENNKDENY